MAIVISQSKTANSAGSYVTSQTIVPTGAFTAGNKGYLFVGSSSDNTAGTATVTDTSGNAWAKPSNLANTTDPSTLQMFVCDTLASGTPTITFTTSSAATLVSLILLEFSGVGAVDATPVSTGHNAYDGANFVTGNMTTTNTNDLILAAVSANDATATFTASGYTQLTTNSSPFNVLNVGYKTVASAGTQSATFATTFFTTGIAAIYSYQATVAVTANNNNLIMLGVG